MRILQFLASALAFCFASFAHAADVPSQPDPASSVGYISFESDLEVQPAAARVFLQPSSKLLLQSETDEAYFLILSDSSGSTLCRMPKLPKYTLQLRFDSDSASASVYLRGAMELDASPFLFKKGQELSLASQDESYWLAVCPLGARRFNVAIPRSSKGVRFSKLSAYELFAQAQAANGLALCKGEWLPKAKADAETRADKLKAERFERLRQMSMTGYLPMADGSLVPGSYKGAGGDKVLFETSDGEKWISPEDVRELPLVQLMAMGALFDAKAHSVQAAALLESGAFPGASDEIQAGLSALGSIPSGSNPGNAAALDCRKGLDALKAALEKRLSERGLAIYSGQVFPADLLKWQLDNGNVLFKSSLWLKPAQICVRCKGSGSISCPDCGGGGQVKIPCSNCSASGKIVCALCGGTGGRQCALCGGSGSVQRRCSHCGGSGSGSSLGFYSPPRPSVITTPSGDISIGIPSPFIIGGGSYIQTPCRYCGGSGYESVPCNACGGKGVIACQKTVRCPVCEGRGFNSSVCKRCSGKGGVECPNCKGMGYSGEPQAPDNGAKNPKGDAKQGTSAPTRSPQRLSPL